MLCLHTDQCMFNIGRSQYVYTHTQIQDFSVNTGVCYSQGVALTTRTFICHSCSSETQATQLLYRCGLWVLFTELLSPDSQSYCAQSKLCAHVCLSVCDSLLNEAQNHTTSTLYIIGRLNLLTLPSHTQICLHMPLVRHITCTFTPVHAGICCIRGQKFN